jgi:predicted phage-related endonuclease
VPAPNRPNPDGLDLSVLGRSDVGCLLGIDEYMSRIELVARIRHGISPPRKSFVESAGNWGRFDEGGIAKMFLLDLGRDPECFKAPSRVGPPGREWSRYSLDYVTGVVFTPDQGWEVASDAPQEIIECKLREWSSFKAQGWGEEGTDGVPQTIYAQVISQLEMVKFDRDFWTGTNIPDLEHVNVAVRVGAFDLKRYRVPYDAELGGLIAAKEEEFWKRYIVGNEVPPLDGSESARRYLDAINPKASKDWLPAENGDVELLVGYREAKAKAEVAKKEQKLWENRIVERIGGAYGLDWGPSLGKIAYRNESGRTSLAKVLADLATAHNIPSEEIEALKEKYRGKPIRKFDPRLKTD